MRTPPEHSELQACLSQPAGTHGVLPAVAAAPAAPAAAPISRSHDAPDFLEFAQAAGGVGIFDLDLLTGDISGTPLFFGLIGLPNRKVCLSRDEWAATIHPEDLEAVVLALGAAVDADAKYQCEYRTLLPTGEVRWLSGRADIVRDAAGQPARAIGTLSDITERKELEAKLRYATESLNIAQTAAGLATFDFNFALNSRICSENFHALLGSRPRPSSTI
jgi:hypothetical protein